MDFGNIVGDLVVVILLIILFAIVLIIQVRTTTKYKLREKIKICLNGKSTKKIDESEYEKTCDICLGKINDNPIAICKCGKLFHDACAQPTETCPYCNSNYSLMEVRTPIKSRCPVCGRFVSGNMCECGAVLPRIDNTFLCKCGNRVDAIKPVCKKCGAIYENVTLQVYKEQK